MHRNTARKFQKPRPRPSVYDSPDPTRRICPCGCEREVTGNKKIYFEPACRKRRQRLLDHDAANQLPTTEAATDEYLERNDPEGNKPEEAT